MGTAATIGAAKTPTAAPAGGNIVPFFYGSNMYAEKYASDTVTLGANQVDLVHNINPGGFLRGYRIEASSSGGALGGGTITGDAPVAIISSASLENIDGAPIVYPMSGWTLNVRQKYTRPWLLPPALRANWSATINPSFSLWVNPEIRHTAGVLSNTDARAQYRSKITIAPLAALVTGGTPTAPVVVVNQWMECWAQPDAFDLEKRPIEELPPGLNLQTLSRKQPISLNAAGADNTLQLALTGNEIRCIILTTRNSSNVRTDLLSDPIRWRIDTKSLGVFSPQEVFDRMGDFYGDMLQQLPRETGTYVLPRFFLPGDLYGESWLSTTNATFMIFQTVTAAGGTNGTVEILTDEVVAVGPVPMELESI